MAISETPVFAEADFATPKPGIWLSIDPECPFDSMLPEAEWPECAIWLVAGASPGDILLSDGKGQSQRARYIIAEGQPPILQVLWRDGAREDGNTFYVFFALEAEPTEADGTFVAASTWEVKCGVQNGSDIAPYRGIGPECRPSSGDAIHSAALASRDTAEMAMRWRWLGDGGN